MSSNISDSFRSNKNPVVFYPEFYIGSARSGQNTAISLPSFIRIGTIMLSMFLATVKSATVTSVTVKNVVGIPSITGASHVQIDATNGLAFVMAGGTVHCYDSRRNVIAGVSPGVPSDIRFDVAANTVVSATSSSIASMGYSYTFDPATLAATFSFSAPVTGGGGSLTYHIVKDYISSYLVIMRAWYICRYDSNTVGSTACTGYLGTNTIPANGVQFSDNYFLSDGDQTGGYIFDKTTASSNSYYFAFKAGCHGLASERNTGKVWILDFVLYVIVPEWNLRYMNCNGGGCSDVASQTRSTSFNAIEVLPNLEMILLMTGSSIELRNRNTLSVIAQIGGSDGTGGIAGDSVSRNFYYDRYRAGGWVFGFVSGGAFKLMVIKPPCGIANCWACGVDPGNRCEMGNPGVPSNATTYYFISRPWTTTDTCVLYSGIPVGFGIHNGNLLSKEVIRCDDPNCADCRNDAQICVLCNSMWYVYDQRCIQPPFPAQFGISLNGTHVVPCLDPYCFNCETSISVCTTCMTDTYRYQDPLDAMRIICLPKPLFPLKYGLNTVSNLVTPCLVPHCYHCQDDINTCAACEPGFFLQGMSDTICVDKPNFLPAHGVHGKRSLPCNDTHCLQCIDYTEICTNCASGWYMFNNGCLDKPNFTPTQGVDTATNYVVTCQDGQCINCEDDFTKCVQCNSGFYVLFDKCEITANFPIGYGIDVAGGSIDALPCTDSNCQNCILDRRFCVSCFPTWFVNEFVSPYICQQKTDFTVGVGAMGLNLANNKVTPCVPAGCEKCIDDHKVCECENPLDFWWYNNQCILRSAIPDTFGIDTATKKVLSCTDSNCQKCVDNTAVCTQCKDQSLVTMPWLYAGRCVDYSGVPDFWGTNPANMAVEPCRSDANCLKCLTDSAVCTKCAQSTDRPYLYQNKCILKAEIPVGLGPDADGVLYPCEVANCVDCRKTKATCNGCSSDYFLFIEQNKCIKVDEIPQTYGIRGTDIVECNENQCLDCRLNSMQCFVYYEVKAEVSEGGPLFTYDVMYTLRLYKETLGGVSSDSETDPKLLDRFLLGIQNSTSVLITRPQSRLLQAGPYQDLVSDQVKSKTEFVMGKDSSIRVRVKLEHMQFTDYRVELQLSEQKFVLYARNYGVRQLKVPPTPVFFLEPAYDGEIVRGQTAMFDPTSVFPIPESQKTNVLSIAAGGAALADSMFLMVKFGQFIKLLTKMQFININFGAKLRAFLQTTTDMFKPPLLKSDNALEVERSVGYRARVTDAKISLDFWGILGDKVAIYLGSWLLRLLLNLKLLCRGRPHKAWLLAMHYHPKVHIILLNLFFLDFFFYGTRAMSHTRVGAYFSKYLAALTCGAVSLDLFLLAMVVCDPDKWAKRYYRNHRERIKTGLITEEALLKAKALNKQIGAGEPLEKSEDVDKTRGPEQQDADTSVNPLLATIGAALKSGGNETSPGTKSDGDKKDKTTDEKDKTTNEKDKTDQKGRPVVTEGLAQLFTKILTAPKPSDRLHQLHKDYEDDPQEGYEYAIEYSQAFDLIHQETFYVEALESVLRLDPQVYASPLARAHGLVALIRLAMYQLVILCGQYANGLVIGSLLAVELAKLVYTMAVYKKYKHLKTVVALAAECLQSLFLVTFLVIGFILHFHELTERVSMSYQVTGIWLIISAVLTEYLLLLVNGLCSAWSAFKDMRIKKKYKQVLDDMKKQAQVGKSKLQLLLDEKAQGAIPYGLLDPTKIRLQNTPYHGDDIQLEEYKKYLERKRKLRRLQALEAEKRPLLGQPDQSNSVTDQSQVGVRGQQKESAETGVSVQNLQATKPGLVTEGKEQPKMRWEIAPQKGGSPGENNKSVDFPPERHDREYKAGYTMGRKRIKVILPSNKFGGEQLIRVRPKQQPTSIATLSQDNTTDQETTLDRDPDSDQKLFKASPSDQSNNIITIGANDELTVSQKIAVNPFSVVKPVPKAATPLESLGFKQPQHNTNRDMSSRFRQKAIGNALNRVFASVPKEQSEAQD